MLLCPVRKPSSGFTLIEVVVVTIIIGVVAAISAPNFIGLLRRNQIAEAIGSIEGAVKEGQKQAERNGDSCTLTIDAALDQVTGNCLLEPRVLRNNIQLNSNASTLIFSGKGTATPQDSATPANTLPTAVLVVDLPAETNSRRCLVVNSLGIIKTGEFTANPTAAGTLIAANCDT